MKKDRIGKCGAVERRILDKPDSGNGKWKTKNS
jgi:hypothetical protein